MDNGCCNRTIFEASTGKAPSNINNNNNNNCGSSYNISNMGSQLPVFRNNIDSYFQPAPHPSSYHMNPKVHPTSAIPPMSSHPSVLSSLNHLTSASLQPAHKRRPPSNHLVSILSQTNQSDVIVSHQHLDQRDLVDGSDSNASGRSPSRQRFVEVRSEQNQEIETESRHNNLDAPMNEQLIPENIELISTDCSNSLDGPLGRVRSKSECENEQMSGDDAGWSFSYITFSKIDIQQVRMQQQLERQLNCMPRKAKLNVESAWKQQQKRMRDDSGDNNNWLAPADGQQQKQRGQLPGCSPWSTDLTPKTTISPRLHEVITKLPF